ncbi:MAG: alanine--glyoxylate aminotransferase family protein [Nitrososphaerales archaeon]|jgi:alanine-glyoxylate transaminase/serine-glyoxylate transaminase/serine-pyruvate transaminase
MLMIPGPSDPEPEVLAELSLPILPHYGDRWMSVYNETTTMLQKVFETKNEVLIIPIPGQLAVEMAAVNLVARGDEAFVCSNGVFSGAIVDSINAVGGKAVPIASELGSAPTLERVKAVVEGSKKGVAGKAIFLVQNETSTGAAVDPEEIFRYCKKKGMLTVLDSISAIGGMPLRADRWSVDYAIGYSSKALGGINGADPVAISPEVWETAKRRKGEIHSTFLDLNSWREAIDEDSSWGHPHPTSMPTSLVVALRKAVSMALQEGLENRYRRHAEAAKELRSGLKDLGLEIFTDPKYLSSTVSVARVDAKWDGELRSRLIKDYNIMIAGGLGPLRGKIVRIGTMGRSARHENVDLTLAALGSLLKQLR